MSNRPRVLVVDDGSFMRKALGSILSQIGFEVMGEAADGQEAIDRCKADRPDLVTLDIHMPVKNGLEALREIKAYDPTIKVVMVSAMGQRKNVLEALGLGAENFIVKPFEETKVLRVLRALDFPEGRSVPADT